MVKILNLILYNNNPEYNVMKDIIGEYLKTTDIQYYFYYYDPNIQDEYMIEGDLLKIKGVESYIPGITLKTIRALKISLNFDYDYVLRSNISTIVNIARLAEFLEKTPIEYGGGHLLTLSWIDRASGINDQKYWDTQYASGTSIIMSRNSVRLFIDNIDRVDKLIIDDVCIGVFFKQYGIPLAQIGNYHSFVNNAHNGSDEVIFYRNRSSSRLEDIYHMRKIIDFLIKIPKSSGETFISIHSESNVEGSHHMNIVFKILFIIFFVFLVHIFLNKWKMSKRIFYIE